MSGGQRARDARAHLLPRLERTLATLDTPHTVAALEEIAAQWRQRRAVYRDNHDWADVIIVDPIPRRRASWWWRLVHYDEPPPPR